MHNPHSRESQGFGFVTMETTEEVEAPTHRGSQLYG